MLQQKLTQAQLAKKVGYSVEFTSLVERGVNAPSFAGLDNLAKVLRVEGRDLFAFEQRRRRASFDEIFDAIATVLKKKPTLHFLALWQSK